MYFLFSEEKESTKEKPFLSYACRKGLTVMRRYNMEVVKGSVPSFARIVKNR